MRRAGTLRLREYRDQLRAVERQSATSVAGGFEVRNAVAAWHARIEKLEAALRNLP
jgi:hypothetical protein